MSEPVRAVRSPVKITDVATAAGVAPMTVSRVINTPERVSPETAERVRAAIAALGYVPNMIAGGLSSRRSRMVAAIVPTIAHPMFADLIEAFTTAMRQAGYEVMLSLSFYPDHGNEDLIRALLGRRPDAMLITGAAHTPLATQLLSEAQIPIVQVWDTSDSPIDMLVGLDHAHAGQAVAAYFLAKGYRSFAAVSASDTRALLRCSSFLEAATKAGATILPLRRVSSPSTIGEGRAAMRALAADLTEPTALFCSSDSLAFGAIMEATQLGIPTPERLGVCGFGNFELSEASNPPFTSVNVASAEAGRTAAAFLLRRLTGEPPGQSMRATMPFTIVERATT